MDSAATPLTVMQQKLAACSTTQNGTLSAVKDRACAAKNQAVEAFHDAKARATVVAASVKEKSLEIVSDKAVQVTAASAAGGAAVIGTSGAATGLLLGGTAGAVLGLLPALFTFGLSIPVGAALGGFGGLLVGGVTGGTAGAAGAGAAGYGAYTKRAEIKSLVLKVQQKAVHYATAAKTRVVEAKAHAASRVHQATETVRKALGTTRDTAAKAAEAAKLKTIETVSDRTVQVTAASAAGGAAVLGAGGAATGLAAGGVVGAAVGLVPALFTFGLSIPFCAAVGSGCGLAAGSVVGGATGFVAGGLSGYGAFTRREVIGTSVAQTWSKVDGAASYVKETAKTSAGYVRARLVGGTGGTSD